MSARIPRVLSVADRVNTTPTSIAAAAALVIIILLEHVARAIAWPQIHISPAATITLYPGPADTPVADRTHTTQIHRDVAAIQFIANQTRTAALVR